MKKILLFLLILVVTLSSAYSTSDYISTLVGYEELGLVTYEGESLAIKGTSFTVEALSIEEYTNRGISFSTSYILPTGLQSTFDGFSTSLDLTPDMIKEITKTAAVINTSLLFSAIDPYSNFINAWGLSSLNIYDYTSSSLFSLLSITGRFEYNTGITQDLIFRAGFDCSIPLVMTSHSEGKTEAYPVAIAFAIGVPLHIRPYIGIAYSI